LRRMRSSSSRRHAGQQPVMRMPPASRMRPSQPAGPPASTRPACSAAPAPSATPAATAALPCSTEKRLMRILWPCQCRFRRRAQ
jgi:hypothetical protein